MPQRAPSWRNRPLRRVSMGIQCTLSKLSSVGRRIPSGSASSSSLVPRPAMLVSPMMSSRTRVAATTYASAPCPAGQDREGAPWRVRPELEWVCVVLVRRSFLRVRVVDRWRGTWPAWRARAMVRSRCRAAAVLGCLVSRVVGEMRGKEKSSAEETDVARVDRSTGRRQKMEGRQVAGTEAGIGGGRQPMDNGDGYVYVLRLAHSLSGPNGQSGDLGKLRAR